MTHQFQTAESFIPNRFLRWIDQFLPQKEYSGLEEANQVRKARLIIALSFFSALCCLTVPILTTVMSLDVLIIDIVAIVVGVSMALNPLILRRTGKFILVGILFLLQSGIMIIGSSAILGGLLAVSTIFLLVWPLENMFLINPKVGLLSAFISIGVLFAFYYFNDQIQAINLLKDQVELVSLLGVIIFSIAVTTIATIGLSYEYFQKKSMRQLNLMVEQLQLVNQELLASKEEAEAATRTKSQFLANMSHEIRTPLNGVIGMASIMLDLGLTPEQEDIAKTIHNSGDSLLNIINDILDFSKVEAGKIELEAEPFDLRSCLEGVLDLLASSAADKGLELLYSIPFDIDTDLIGDVTRIRQILLNIIGNAIKFTEKGEIFIEVNTEKPAAPEEDDQSKIEYHFSVRDTGIGIPEADLNRLFKSFSQVDSSTTRKFGGTGLGLAISKNLSSLMGGDMWVESKVDEGSCFHFTANFQLANLNPSKTLLSSGTESIINKRVLIIDDNESNRNLLNYQLQHWGMQPELVDSRERALALLDRDQRYDLIILNDQMAEIDGLKLGEQLSQREGSADVPMIMLSSQIQVPNADQQFNYLKRSILKPLKPGQLLGTLNSIFTPQPMTVNGKAKSNYQLPASPIALLGAQNPLNILLVEDNIVNQKVILKMLAKLGYKPTIVSDGAQAFETVQNNLFDLVLMDAQMPIMDGITATRKIRNQLPLDIQPKIVAMTANALVGDKEKYLACGMDDYISKPIRIHELETILKRIALLDQSNS